VLPSKNATKKLEEKVAEQPVKIEKVEIEKKALEEKPKVENITTVKEENEINLLQVWGQFLISLSPQNYPVLYTAVIDASPLKIENKKLILQAENELAKLTLSKPENKNVIELFFKNNDVNIQVEVTFKQEQKEDNVIETLKDKFGSSLKIVE
jgi:hypothetical protein